MWLEDIDGPADEVPEAADGALARVAQHGLEPGERLLDWVEVRAVGREEAPGDANRLALLLHGDPLVAR